MGTPIIQSVGSTSGAGTPGEGRNDLVGGETVTLSDTNVANVGATYFWQFEDTPIGTSPTLLNHTTPSPSFVVDPDPTLAGSYRIKCTVDGIDSAVEVLAVPLRMTGARIPSFLERVEYDGDSNAKGWHQAQTEFMRNADELLRNPGPGSAGDEFTVSIWAGGRESSESMTPLVVGGFALNPDAFDLTNTSREFRFSIVAATGGAPLTARVEIYNVSDNETVASSLITINDITTPTKYTAVLQTGAGAGKIKTGIERIYECRIYVVSVGGGFTGVQSIELLKSEVVCVYTVLPAFGLVPGNTLPNASITIGDAITGSSVGSVLFIGTGGLLAQDNANFFWDVDNRKLGIGTNSPTQVLDVVGAVRARGGLIVDPMTAGSVWFTGTSGALTQDAANLYWDNTNKRLGIGTGAPGVPLEIAGAASTAGLALQAGSALAVSAAATARIRYNESTNKLESSLSGAAWTILGSATIGQEVFGGATPGSVLYVGASSLLAQDNANFFWDYTNVRLGIGTNVPSEALHVVGNTYITGKLTVDGAIDPTSLTLADAGNAAYVEFGEGASAALAPANTGRLRYNTAGGQVFQVSLNGGAYVDLATSANISGTPNTLAKFTGANTVGDSGITDDGTTADINRDITKFGAASDGFTFINQNTINAGYSSASIVELGINFSGYQNTSAFFRNTTIYNGANAAIATFTGSDKSLQVNGMTTISTGVPTGLGSLQSGTVLALEQANGTISRLAFRSTAQKQIDFYNTSASPDGFVAYDSGSLPRGMIFGAAGSARHAINSSGQHFFGDTAYTAVSDNVDVITVANTGTGQTGASKALLRADFTGSLDTTSTSNTTHGAYIVMSGTRSAGANALDQIAYRAAMTNGQNINYGFYADVAGAGTNYSFYSPAGSLYNAGGIQGGQYLQLADSSAAVSDASTGRIRYSAAGGALQISLNGAAYVDMMTSSNISGTTNTLAKFTGTNVVGDSGITDDGTTIDINRDVVKMGLTDGSLYFIGDWIGAGLSSDTDGVDLAMNYGGFGGGNTRYRDLVVYDGRNVPLATFAGSTKAVDFVGYIGVGIASDNNVGVKIGKPGGATYGLYVSTGLVHITESLTVGNNATLGDSASGDTHSITGALTHTTDATIGYTVTNTRTALAANSNAIQATQTGTYDATGGDRVPRGMLVAATGTRSAGTNNVHNRAIEATASGGQINTALYTNFGDNWFNIGSGMSRFYGNVEFGTTAGKPVLKTSGSGTYLQVEGSGIIPDVDNTGAIGIPSQRWNSASFGTGGITSAGAVTVTGASVFNVASTNTTVGGVSTDGLWLRNTDATTNNLFELYFVDSANVVTTTIASRHIDHGNHYGHLIFATRGADGYQERMRVASDGRVWMGDTSASSVAPDVAVLNIGNTGTGMTASAPLIDGTSTASFDTTAGAIEHSILQATNTATRSVGGNNLATYGVYAWVTGSQFNVGIRSHATDYSFYSDLGAIYNSGNAQFGAGTNSVGINAAPSNESLIVAGKNGNHTAIFSNTANSGATTNDRAAVYAVQSGTFNTTSQAIPSYGVWGQSNGTKSAGANPLTNYGVVGVASGGDTNYGVYGSGSQWSFYGAAGNLYNAAAATIGGNLFVGTSDGNTHTARGSLTVQTTGADSEASLAYVNDARTWRTSVNGTSGDAFCITESGVSIWMWIAPTTGAATFNGNLTTVGDFSAGSSGSNSHSFNGSVGIVNGNLTNTAGLIQTTGGGSVYVGTGGELRTDQIQHSTSPSGTTPIEMPVPFNVKGPVKIYGITLGNDGHIYFYPSDSPNQPSIGYAYSVNAAATGYINWTGYAAGTSQDRDLVIGDGKGAVIAQFHGSNKGVTLGGGPATPAANSVIIIGGLQVNSNSGEFLYYGTSKNIYLTPFDGICANYDTNGTATLYLNGVGYQGGVTQFRDLAIYNGKGAAIATFTGSTKVLALSGDLTGLAATFSGNVTVGDATADWLYTPGYFGVGTAADATAGIRNLYNGRIYGAWFSHTATGVNANRIGLEIDAGGSRDTTAAAWTNTGITIQANATRSAGSNNLTNIAVSASASGAQINYSFYGSAGSFYNAGDAQVDGNATLGNASTDTHTLNGNLTLSNSPTAGPVKVGAVQARVRIGRQFLTSGTTYTPTTGTRAVLLRMCGGGGGGGSLYVLNSTTIGGGGACGSYLEKWIDAGTVVTGGTMAIGAAGAAGNNSTGGTGGDTTVVINGITYTAKGGLGGTAAVWTAGSGYTAAGGLSQSGSGASSGSPDYIVEEEGDFGTAAIVNATGPVYRFTGGKGGSNPLGIGGEYHMTGGTVRLTGKTGTGYGAGGGGMVDALATGGVVVQGGPGTQGVIIVEEYA